VTADAPFPLVDVLSVMFVDGATVNRGVPDASRGLAEAAAAAAAVEVQLYHHLHKLSLPCICTPPVLARLDLQS
jgi:hypothetical protein